MYSERPTGYDEDEDPFVYHNGGTRKVLISPEKAKEKQIVMPKPKRVGRVMKKSLNLTDSIRIGDFNDKVPISPNEGSGPKMSGINVSPLPTVSNKKSVRFTGDELFSHVESADKKDDTNEESKKENATSSAVTPSESKSQTNSKAKSSSAA
mmetsp:Transcript_37137/g.48834  ORF Transcript_37137/g.48834 Transcript_37137/m.48834 type:complete len:152 (+) Transcript_37137:1203-1658(+)|eukprot:CAMPEP_0185576410 /NCGR_PEP_ID=MMETSP0434-20130131/7341_1 /TAXON_ID=626734 ORGANISM="Favella taraikaensis, Strain Fe Narragansett Bay" /NCGR_SAMPLE_ID=MMETSP0434 /ASSEMBLY_ACC=CAM_ASM_000379 /LENGTH=151 /DNA_ID=CAMNT_0028193601 /DNA_START=1106 /DNA_END=1561 /DNA_ORIENTATION=+